MRREEQGREGKRERERERVRDGHYVGCLVLVCVEGGDEDKCPAYLSSSETGVRRRTVTAEIRRTNVITTAKTL